MSDNGEESTTAPDASAEHTPDSASSGQESPAAGDAPFGDRHTIDEPEEQAAHTSEPAGAEAAGGRSDATIDDVPAVDGGQSEADPVEAQADDRPFDR